MPDQASAVGGSPRSAAASPADVLLHSLSSYAMLAGVMCTCHAGSDPCLSMMRALTMASRKPGTLPCFAESCNALCGSLANMHNIPQSAALPGLPVQVEYIRWCPCFNTCTATRTSTGWSVGRIHVSTFASATQDLQVTQRVLYYIISYYRL